MPQLPDNSNYQQHLARHQSIARESAKLILPYLQRHWPFQSYLDVGCGTGTWLAVAQDMEIPRLFGVDGPWLSIDQFEIGGSNFRVADVKQPIDLEEKFDLVSCLEVASDVPADFEDALIQSLARHSDAILFSSAAKTQRHKTHVNRRWQNHWVSKFSDLGFESFDIVRPQFWSDSRVGAHYRQNCILYARGAAAKHIRESLEKNDFMPSFPVDVVHPEIAPRPVEEYSLKVLLKATLAAVVRRLKNGGGKKVS